MIYSRWKPDIGGYEYFSASDRIGIADDLPTPSLPGGTSIGVPSTEIGRPLPAGAKKIGEGPEARGSIVPFSRSGLGAVSFTVTTGGVMVFMAGAIAGWYLWSRR